MKNSILITQECGKNHFLACCGNMRFLFSRLPASVFITSPEAKDMDQFEVQRKGGVIITGGCYLAEDRYPIFWIDYSELSSYRTEKNYSTPHETLYAEDFLPGDMICSDVNAQENIAKRFANMLSFTQMINTKMQEWKQVAQKANIEMRIAPTHSFFKREESTQDVLDIRTFIVCPSF